MSGARRPPSKRESSSPDQVRVVLSRLQRHATKSTREAMARYGISSDYMSEADFDKRAAQRQAQSEPRIAATAEIVASTE